MAERRFIDACEAVGYQVRKATAQEDIYEHIDYWVLRKENWYGVDVVIPKTTFLASSFTYLIAFVVVVSSFAMSPTYPS